MASTTGSVGRLSVSAASAQAACYRRARPPKSRLGTSRTGSISGGSSQPPIQVQKRAFSSPNARIDLEERLAGDQEHGDSSTKSGRDMQAKERGFTSKASPENTNFSGNRNDNGNGGAFTRRLEQLASDAIEASPREAAKAAAAMAAAEETDRAGDGDSTLEFDIGLKRQLEERIRGANLRATHPQAFALSELPSSAGRGTRDIAGARAWTGDEAVEDTALRMLVDANKPLKSPRSSGNRTSGGGKGPAAGMQPRVPTVRKPSASTGSRLAEARDRSSAYTAMKDTGMSKQEREEYSRELRARFQPHARELPATLSGLASLANERIEEAIARGQFKNLPRGKVLERDHNASSPFIDTTEYLMNNMIKKQDIVPPWIEKQQEVALAASRFRKRLRSDWQRHAARVIASTGGSLDEQMRRADEHARAEKLLEAEAQVAGSVPETNASTDHFTEISPTGELSSSTSRPDGLVTDQRSDTAGEIAANTHKRQLGIFRDPAWEAIELSFHKLSIESLNSKTRTYNLMAPRPAQKPYFSLQRELKACYRDVAPLVASEIRERALAPKRRQQEYKLGAPAGLLDQVARSKANVHDEDLDRKGYGLKQFWRDLWDVGDKRI
jgi:hypothetical protein